jgi:hypothetical protein
LLDRGLLTIGGAVQAAIALVEAYLYRSFVAGVFE